MPASITLTVSHLPSSTSFFLSCLQPLNYVYRGRVNNTIGFGYPDAPPDFWISQSVPGVPPGPAHVAFPALSQRHVHEFFMNAIKAGGKIHGEPALRDIDTGYYCAAVIDLDGNSIEAVYRADLARGNKENSDRAAKSVASMTKSSTKSKAPTVASSTSRGSKARTVAASEVRSVATSASPRSTSSKASTQARSVASSKTSPSSASKAPSNAHKGDVFDNLLADAKGTIAMAKELVDQARPHMNSSDSAKSNGSSGTNHTGGGNDAIVGTLLGVAAGAALTYAFTTRSGGDGPAPVPASTPASKRNFPPRSETAPSYSEERYYYYHDQPERQQHAIEAAPSSYYGGSHHLIQMIDNDSASSSHTRSARPRRRNSLSELSAAKTTTTSKRSSHATTKLMLEAPPPSSYRGPTVSTQLSRKSSNRSRASSATRIPTATTTTRQDEGYGSASESRSRVPQSHITRRSSFSHSHSHSHSQKKPSSSTTTTNKHPPTPSRAPASTTSRRQSIVTAIESPTPSPSAAQYPLPPSRAATWTGGSTHNDSRSGSTHSHNHTRPSKTVIGKLTAQQLQRLERDRGGCLDDVTGSVVGKVRELDGDRVGIRREELRPDDSVSNC